MPQAVFAADPTSIIVVQAGVAYHRRMYATDKRIGAFSDSSFGSVASKWGMVEIEGAPEVGDGFPLLKMSKGKYQAIAIEPAFKMQNEAELLKNSDDSPPTS